MTDPRTLFRPQLDGGDRLCLLPMSRMVADEPVRLGDELMFYPPGVLRPETFRIVSYPAGEWRAAEQRSDVLSPGVIQASGRELAWLKSAGTGLEIEDVFEGALLALPVTLDWDRFLDPPSHEDHLEAIRTAIAKAEDVLDRVRFEYGRMDLPDTLPGAAGYLPRRGFTAALFYALEDHESYIVGGRVVTHEVVAGLGLEVDQVGPAPPLGTGEVGGIARHALRLHSLALEAPNDTAKFVQLMSLIEYLADPFAFQGMQDAKKAIGRHVAKDRAEYDAIMADFKVLTSEGGKVTAGHKGYRHNIVHLGRRLDDLIGPAERRDVMRRLQRYVGVVIDDLIDLSNGTWADVLAHRRARGQTLGFEPPGPPG